MEKCWEEHWELHTKVNLVFIKDQVWFYHVDHLRLIGSVTVRMQMMGRVIIWKIQKELELEINELYTMVKCWVPHSELQTEANLGIMKYQGNYYQVDLVRL